MSPLYKRVDTGAYVGMMESLTSSVESMDQLLGTPGNNYKGWAAAKKLWPQEGGPYHSWGPEGIDLQQVLRYTDVTFNKAWEGGNRYWYHPFAAFISIDRNNTPTMWIPCALISTRRAGGAGMQMQIMMQHFQTALSRQLFQYKERYQALVTVLTTTGSIPLLFDHSDYHSCSDPNYTVTKREFEYYEFALNALSVPLFTLSQSPTTCNHALPVPTYKTYEYSMLGSGNTSWQDKMNE
jgi:hypothetical protein